MKTWSLRRPLRAALPPALFAAAALSAGMALSSPGPSPQIPKLPAGFQPVDESPDKPHPITLEQVPPGALVPQGPAPTLTVLGTGDVVGYLEPCG